MLSSRAGRAAAVDYLAAVDRDAYVRAARRREALDALAFEQDREAMLVEQLEDVLAETAGPQLDTHLFTQMSSDDAVLVRVALGQDLGTERDDGAGPDEDALEPSLDHAADEADISEQDDVEDEIARLQSELESSRRVQAALGQYLELLSGPAAG
jgi:hypothetical protein